MADGHKHEQHGIFASLLPLAVFAVASVSEGHTACLEAVLVSGGILFGAFLLSPDLDIWRSRPNNWWGPLRVLWAPYAWAFDHRGLSHSWITGPLSRLLYLGLPVGTVWYLGWEFQGAGPWLLWVTAGVILGNWVHLLGDGILPFRKIRR
jgi:uncharacterized metal-binding protein